jgi:hypothetical protein
VKGSKISMSQVTELASGQITAIDTLTIELVQANETPAVVMIRWPAKRPCCIRDCSSPLLTPLPASRCCRRTACSDQAGASAGTLARREVIATGLRATQMHVADLVSTNLASARCFPSFRAGTGQTKVVSARHQLSS